MPYSFSSSDRTLAIELGSLRKLGKARRLASADSVNRMARRIEATSGALDTRGDDDDDRRGWYGGSRGHAEAARRGWENRR